MAYSDASSTAVGDVLGQLQHNKEAVISYWSRQLTKAERKYSAIKREALAAVSTIKEFLYPYVYGFSFKLITDHNPLVCSLKDVGIHLSRWMMYNYTYSNNKQFDFEVQFQAGKAHTNADTLSRLRGVMPVMEHQLGEGIDVQKAQEIDKQLSPIIVALSNNAMLPDGSSWTS